MSKEGNDFDLDFTKWVPPVARASASPASPAYQAEGTEELVGSAEPKGAGNLICYARAAAVGAAPPRPDAPVLVVEDHEGSRRLLEKMLALEGFAVRAVADSRDFARELRQPPLPRLILLDVELPRISGFQILQHLRQHPSTSAIPIVMVTARSEQKDFMQSLSLGANGYLSKPVSLKSLRSVIDTVLPAQARAAR